MMLAMTTTANPYAADLGDRDPLEAFSQTPFQMEALLAGWTDEQFERSYAPGKWSVRQVLIHLAQTELALGTRVRFALAQDGYAAQSFSQDDWLPADSHMDAPTALGAYTALRRMNVALFRNLTREALDRPFAHPEYGTLTVGWVLAQMAGHDIHHQSQIANL
jgi:uncharacterized damage-inducible protein DinB